MGKFGGPSPKRHMGFSNDEEFMQQLMDRGGFMSLAERQALGESKLTKKGSKFGCPAFTGCKKMLKQSQCFAGNKSWGYLQSEFWVTTAFHLLFIFVLNIISVIILPLRLALYLCVCPFSLSFSLSLGPFFSSFLPSTCPFFV